MFMSEEELTVQVAQIDRIKVHDMYLAKAGEDQVLKELASNTARTDQKNSCLIHEVSFLAPQLSYRSYLLDLPVQRPEGLFCVAFSKHSLSTIKVDGVAYLCRIVCCEK